MSIPETKSNHCLTISYKIKHRLSTFFNPHFLWLFRIIIEVCAINHQNIHNIMKKQFFKKAFVQKAILVLALTLGSQLTFAQELAKKEKAGVLTFESTEIDYGSIQQKADGHRTFKFTNTGDAPIVITNVKGSCGCTVPTAPKDPIMPGQSSEIQVKYDTNRVGAFSKTVTVTSNASEPTKLLKIKGTVLKAEGAENPVPVKG